MTSGVDRLTIHTGIPGRLATPTTRAVRRIAADLGRVGCIVGKFADDDELTAVWKAPSSRRGRYDLVLSSSAVLGATKIGDGDIEVFRPEAAERVESLIRQVKPQRCDVVVDSLPPALVMQLAYERELRSGTEQSAEERFDLDIPLVDLRDLRDRLQAIPGISSVEIVAVHPNDRPSLAWIGRNASMAPPRKGVTSRLRALSPRGVHRERDEALTVAAVLEGVTTSRYAASVSGLEWCHRSAAAALAVNAVSGIEGAARRELNGFIATTLRDDPGRTGIWSDEQYRRIVSAHEHVDLGLFAAD